MCLILCLENSVRRLTIPKIVGTLRRIVLESQKYDDDEPDKSCREVR